MDIKRQEEDDELRGFVFKVKKRNLTLQITPEFHFQLQKEASNCGMSLRALCVQKLMQPLQDQPDA